MRTTDELIEALSREAVTAKPAPHPFVLSLQWMAAAGTYLAVSQIITDVRPDLLAKLHEPWFAAEIAVLGVIFITTSLSAALLSFPDFHQKRRVAYTPALLYALLLLIIFFAWYSTNPATPLPADTYECTICIFLISVLPAAWYFFAIRKMASTHARGAGGIVLLCALSIGALWLRLYEPNDSFAHVMQWHYLPMIGFGGVGMWLGKRILKW